MEIKERLKTNEELIRASQEESRLAREQSHSDRKNRDCSESSSRNSWSLLHKAIHIYLFIDLIVRVRINICLDLLDYLSYYFENLIITFRLK